MHTGPCSLAANSGTGPSSSIGVVLGGRSESSRGFGLREQVTLGSSMIGWRSPLFGISVPPFGQLLCEASVESLDGREW